MKKILKIVIIIAIFIIVVITIVAAIDFILIMNFKEPWFCYETETHLDGGSFIGKGIEYIIARYYNISTKENKMRIGILHTPKNPFSNSKGLLYGGEAMNINDIMMNDTLDN